MTLFGFKKKGTKEAKKASCCCCGGNCEVQETTKVTGKIESIKVLGAGCKTCHRQYEYTKEAVNNLNIPVEVEYITDMEKVMSYGVMTMPAIVINDKVVSAGKVLNVNKVEKLLGEN